MWFILSLFVGLTFAANRIILRSVLTKNSNPIAFGALHELLAGLFLLPVGLFYFSLPHSLHTWIALGIGIFLIFVTDLLAFMSLRKLEASLFQIINQIRHVVVLFGAYFFFTEQITFPKIISIFFIMLGIYFALKGKSKLTFNRETLYALISTVAISFGLLFIKMASVDVAPAFSASLGFITSGLLIYVFLFITGSFPNYFLPQEHKKQLFLAAGLFSVFEFALFTALAIGQASKVTPVTQSSMIFTIVGGYIFLKEQTHMRQKIVGSLLIAFGIGIMYFI